MLTVKEAAQAFKISERTLREMIRQRSIPFLRVGSRSIRFDERELREQFRVESKTQKREQ